MSNQANIAMLPSEFVGRGIGLGQLKAIFRAYLRLILVTAVICMVVVTAATLLLMKKSYDATATVFVEFEVNSPDTSREFPTLLAVSYMTTQTAFIGGAAVLGPVIDDLGWMGDPEKRKGYVGPDTGLRDHLIWKVLSPSLVIDNPKDSRIITITYSADTPAEAARVANAVAEKYVEQHGSRLREPARRRAEEYLKSVDELKTRFVAAQQSVAEFRKRTGLIDLSGNSLREDDRLREINSVLLQAELDDRNASIRERQVSRLKRQVGSDDIEYAQSPGVMRLRDDLLTAESRFAELSKTLGPRHPDYLVAENQVRDLRAKLTQETSGFSSGVVDNATTAAGQSSATVSGLRERMAEESSKLLTIRSQQDEAAHLLSELEATEKIYKGALDEYGKIIRNADTQYNDVSLIAAATPPVRHSKPKASVNLVLGFLGGFIAAALAALLWELTHRRVRCAEDFEEELGEPVLAVIGEGAK